MSDTEEPDGGNCTGDEAGQVLSPVAEAARAALRARHRVHRKRCWNVTHGKVVGEVHQTPPRETWGDAEGLEANAGSHSDCFPDKVYEMMTKATSWLDVTSLSVPDGKFEAKFKEAIQALHESGSAVTIRLLFGNIPGMPTDCDGLIETLTEGLPGDSQIKLWVGAWRKKVSWNHSKIVAVDGQYLFQGGHNLWDGHYLQNDPVHDLSMEAEGQVAVDGHVFADRMWKFIIDEDSEYFAKKMVPDWVPLIARSRVGVSQFPKAAGEYPPAYSPASQPLPLAEAVGEGDIAMITCGRYGALHSGEESANPSDSAITAMLGAAQKCVKMSLQDLGPLTLPVGELRPIPGGTWPTDNLKALGLAIWERGVQVDIVLSNPFACPGGLNPNFANYGNGWTAQDVGSEIVKAILEAVPESADEDGRMRDLLREKLRIATLSVAEGVNTWADGQTEGNHAKFFIVDDLCYYLGSQNLYIANLAEWGIVVDSEEQTQKVLEEYWSPLWANSFSGQDCDIDAVMDGLGVDRSGCPVEEASEEDLALAMAAELKAGQGGLKNSLGVWIKRATNLRDADTGEGSSDSYCCLSLRDGDGKVVSFKRATRVIPDGGPNPEWNEFFVFEGLETPGAYTLKITVADKDSLFGLEGEAADWLAKDDKLGGAKLDLGTLTRSEDWQDMELMIADGWFSDSTIVLAVNNKGEWGN